MKYIIRSQMYLWVLALTSSLFFVQCTDDNSQNDIMIVDANGYSNFNQQIVVNQLNAFPTESLSSAEEAGILFMREEEKLAHDVYSRLYEEWNNPIFDNISNSESTHMEAVLLLIEKYGLTDPVNTNGIGIFVNSTLQQLYNDLTVTGLLSEIEALKVGAVIEEIDIRDLEEQLVDNVDNQDITVIYQNLQKGSRNHLRAFVNSLDVIGVEYQPQYLTQNIYDDIISDDMERGGN